MKRFTSLTLVTMLGLAFLASDASACGHKRKMKKCGCGGGGAMTVGGGQYGGHTVGTWTNGGGHGAPMGGYGAPMGGGYGAPMGGGYGAPMGGGFASGQGGGMMGGMMHTMGGAMNTMTGGMLSPGGPGGYNMGPAMPGMGY